MSFGLRWSNLEACQPRNLGKGTNVGKKEKESVNEGSQQLVSIMMGFGLGFKTIGVFSQLLKFLFFMVHFSKLAFNHNQEKGSNSVVLCTTEGCNRAISGEKALYFTSRCIFYCLVCFSSKTLAYCGHYSTFLERHSDDSLRPDAK